MTSRLPVAGPSCLHLHHPSIPGRRVIRKYATIPSSPSPKIRTIPFHQPPRSAMHKLHIYGLIASGQISNLIFAALLKLFGPNISPLAKELGLGQNFVMREFKPVLYPIWRCDVAFEGPVKDMESKQEGRAWFGAKEAHVPGNAFAPLSYLSYAIPDLPRDLPPYNPEIDHQPLEGGFEPVAVPFTVAPMSVMERIRKSLGSKVEWGSMELDMTRWSQKMAAFYPIYFPIYVAECEYSKEGDVRRFNAILDGNDSDISLCRVSHPPPKEIYDQSKSGRWEGRFSKNYYINPFPFIAETSFNSSLIKESGDWEDVEPKYMEYMSPKPTSSQSIPPSPLVEIERQLKSEVDWDDLRIRAWGVEERDGNGDYFETLREIATAEFDLKKLRDSSPGEDPHPPRGLKVGIDPETKRPSMVEMTQEELTREYESTLAELRKKEEKDKPEWMRDWEEKQRVRRAIEGEPTTNNNG